MTKRLFFRERNIYVTYPIPFHQPPSHPHPPGRRGRPGHIVLWEWVTSDVQPNLSHTKDQDLIDLIIKCIIKVWDKI